MGVFKVEKISSHRGLEPKTARSVGQRLISAELPGLLQNQGKINFESGLTAILKLISND